MQLRANIMRAGEAQRNSLCVQSRFYGQATKGVCVDALAQVGDEGRGQLRKASGSR
jgi:hypothetical protein